MKKICTLLILLLFISNYAGAQHYFTQYFDGADTLFKRSINIAIEKNSSNIWQIGRPKKIIFDTAATKPNVLVTDTVKKYPKNNTSRFLAKILIQTPTTYGILAVQWKQKLNMTPDHDGGIIEYTLDKGKTWINVFNNPVVQNFYGFDKANVDTLKSGEYAFSGTDSTWRNVWLCFSMSWLSKFNYNDTIQIRFTFKSDGDGGNKEGWMIDNMMSHVTHIHTIMKQKPDNYLTVYPNPAKGVVHIEAEERMEYHLIERMELVDPLGRIIEAWNDIPTKFWFETTNYQNGLYFLKVKTNIKSEAIPLIISN